MLRAALNLVVLVGVLNFLAFWIVAALIGGDALAGNSGDGRFYLSSHGQLTEVDQRVFLYSLAHAISIMFTHPMAIAAIAALQFLDWRKRRIFHADIDQTLHEMRKADRAS